MDRPWPGLASLSLSHANLVRNSCLLSPAITALKLRSVSYDNSAVTTASGAAFFLQFLAKLPALKDPRLELSIPSGIAIEQTTVRLLALRTLELVDSPQLCAQFLRLIHAPAIASTSIDLSERLPSTDDGMLPARALQHVILTSRPNARRTVPVRMVSFDVAHGRLLLTYQTRESTDADVVADPAIKISLQHEDKLCDALRLVARSPFPSVTSLSLMPRHADMDTVECWHRLSGAFPKVQELILGQTSYHSASMFLGITDCAKGRPLFPDLKVLVLRDICHHRYGAGEVGEGLARCLQVRAQMAKPVKMLVLRRCTFLTKKNFVQIRRHVSSVDCDRELV